MKGLLLLVALSLTTVSAQKRGTILLARTAGGAVRFTVGPNLFGSVEIDSLIRADVHVDSLIVYPPIIRVTEGGSYELKKLFVLAIDSKGIPVAKAPLELELNAFNCSFGLDRIMGFRRGQAKMKIISLLPRKEGKTKTGVEITVEVTPWPN